MSSHIMGIKPPDEKWKKMKAIWDSCTAAGIDVPEEVSEFFGDEEPDDAGVEVGLGEEEGVTDYEADCREGFEVDLSKLPADVKIVRFWNAY